MHVKIRIYTSSHATQNDLILPVIASTTIGELQNIIYSKMKVKTAKQKLYYGGKELIRDHCILDYNIKSSDVIQLMIKTTSEPIKDISLKNEKDPPQTDHIVQAKSVYYQVGDCIDVIYRDLGAWFEAKIIGIFTRGSMEESPKEDELIFKIVMDRNEKTAPIHVKFDDIRPRSSYIYNRLELEEGMVVFVNYNIQQPKERGYWYDFKITTVMNEMLQGVLIMGRDDENLENCAIEFRDEVMKIEVATPLTERSTNRCEKIPWRNLPLYCNSCKDVSTKDCKECSCNICGKKSHIDVLIICEECDCTYHLFCLDPPLTEIPPEPEWYCPDCKTDINEIVKPGEKLKVISPRFNLSYDFGSISGIEVGTCWRSQTEVYEVGIHCAPNIGIYAREKYGVYSIMLGGRYIEDIVDDGDEFYMSVSDGQRSPKNNEINIHTGYRRSKINKALALNCNKIQDNDGFGIAEDWKNGKPIRIIRNYLLGSSSKFAPKQGFRYDGIYKVVEYFLALRRSGDIAWRYLLRRDDEALPPWVPISMTNSHKKLKLQPFEIDPEIEKWIRRDVVNQQIWEECVSYVADGREVFFAKVREAFKCVCCCDIVWEPFTIDCGHTVCIKCLLKCFEADIVICPTCRLELENDYPMELNFNLQTALKMLFPGYERDRL